MAFNKAAYLERLGLDEAISVDVAGLVTLHMAQAYSIPFENLDILLGRGIDLSQEAVFTKLVDRKRGGYCFELNGIFIEALKAFGFDVRPLLARVHINGETTGRTHKVCLVSFGEQKWLADVGFGANGLRAPIPLSSGFKSEQDGQIFRLVDDGASGMMMQCRSPKGWLDLYSFDLEHVSTTDIEMGNHYTSTHKNSIFTVMPIVTMPTADGRVTLRQDNLRVEGGKTVVDTTLARARDYHAALANNFGLDFTAQEATQLFEKCKA